MGFWEYRSLARKRGPDPFWTPVVPLHRLVSFPLSYLYAGLGFLPLGITFLGLALFLGGAATIVAWPHAGWGLWAGLVLLKLGVVHDYCDGEVARWRIAKGRQSPRLNRVGIFADIWAYTVIVQGLMPLLLGVYAWRMGGSVLWLLAGMGVSMTLVSSYVVAFGQAAYWPERAPDFTKSSPTFTAGSTGLLKWLQQVYFQLFETAVFTTHATIVIVFWALAGGFPPWAQAYVAFCLVALGAAFLIAHARAFSRFDRA
ncbi:MAG: hypothetical protein ACYDBQ_12380 [Thermoplasmatota archaeon]